ncbi:MAG: tetrathionate reductase family octaheme c-type cytochrome [Desulfobacterales bacterium]|nr:tetrathionate reductase family octaheme c-type cytochrome [Desulfobacterales bacterium]
MSKKSILAVVCVGGLICAVQASANENHKQITGPFNSPMEVTQKCLECHEEAAHDVMQTSHWAWELEQEITGEGNVFRGKKNAINNFCISINSNQARCTSCHISYGWKDDSFDFTDKTRIDCLVCHDETGTYKKPGPAAGMPAGYTGNEKYDKKPVDLVKVAQNVGMPTRDNCIVCHGYGGGGNNVKHGDIDSSIKKPSRELDVHMGVDGQDFSCQECHTTENHEIKGNAMVVSPGGKNHISCTDCHDEKPHTETLLNSHMDTVSCQTCHIPSFAKEIPTKLSWDWSTAGEDRVSPEHDQYGKATYNKKKGDFIWGKDVVPAYAWYNGKGGAYLAGDKIDPDSTTKLSWPEGDRNDPKAQIYPFKIHKGKQIYDSKNNYLITPKVFGTKGDPDAYWVNYDWNKAAAAGMKASGLAYSGEYGFAPTEMYWRINHMVVPADNALGCLDCHGDNGRLDWQALGYKADPMRDKSASRSRHDSLK